MNTLRLLRHARAWLGLTVVTLLGLCASPSWAQDDPPGRVGRLAEVQGSVSWYDGEQGVWSGAERNRPLTSGDRLSTGAQSRAELRVGSTVLRLSAGTELEVVRLDDERMSFQLHSGSLALRVRSREVAREVEMLTTEARLRPDRAGHYRFDRSDDTTYAGAWRGALRIDDPAGFIIETGQRAELWREGRPGRQLRFAWSNLPSDAFGDWVARDEQRDERSASSRYVSPEMTGAEDLDRHGRWERHDEFGAVWFPIEVRAEWAPYRYGHWAWVRPWGWTWVDEAPWGFAPFHYGRWVSWRGRWGWVPGDYVARPVYAPALVAWVGGSGFSVGINIGGPAVGWVPLAPREWYVPYYSHTPVYVDRINPYPPGRRYERPVPTGPIMYNNQGVPGAVTVVPRDVLLNRQPVGRGAIDAREWQRSRGQEPLPRAAPPEREAPQFRGPRPQPALGFVQPVPGGAQPLPTPPGEREGRGGRDDRDRGEGRDRRDGRDGRDGRRPEPLPAPTMQQQPQTQQPGQPPSGVIDLRRERPPAAVPPQPSAAPPQQSPPQSQQPPRPPRENAAPEREHGRNRDRDRDSSRSQQGPLPAPNPAPTPVTAAPARPAAPQPAAQPAQPAPAAAAAPARATAPPPAPAAAPVPRPTPMPAPERAREREAERDRAREEDRKRQPEGRQQRDRERENLR